MEKPTFVALTNYTPAMTKLLTALAEINGTGDFAMQYEDQQQQFRVRCTNGSLLVETPQPPAITSIFDMIQKGERGVCQLLNRVATAVKLPELVVNYEEGDSDESVKMAFQATYERGMVIEVVGFDDNHVKAGNHPIRIEHEWLYGHVLQRAYTAALNSATETTNVHAHNAFLSLLRIDWLLNEEGVGQLWTALAGQTVQLGIGDICIIVQPGVLDEDRDPSYPLAKEVDVTFYLAMRNYPLAMNTLNGIVLPVYDVYVPEDVTTGTEPV
jgi:hypothetical protein